MSKEHPIVLEDDEGSLDADQPSSKVVVVVVGDGVGDEAQVQGSSLSNAIFVDDVEEGERLGKKNPLMEMRKRGVARLAAVNGGPSNAKETRPRGRTKKTADLGIRLMEKAGYKKPRIGWVGIGKKQGINRPIDIKSNVGVRGLGFKRKK